MTLKGEHPRLVGGQYSTGEKQRNSPRRNRESEWLNRSAQLWMQLKVKVQCYKEQYCIGTSNVRSMKQGKL